MKFRAGSCGRWPPCATRSPRADAFDRISTLRNQEQIMAVAQAEILDKIASMTVLELSELIKAMEQKFGVSATAAVGGAWTGGCGRARCACTQATRHIKGRSPRIRWNKAKVQS